MLVRAAVLSQLLRWPSRVRAQGCAETCPPLNLGVEVPSLCEGDLAETFANMDREYETCHPAVGDALRLRDFMGPGRVTVISNFYTGCNAGRRETGVFTHVAQRYWERYGPWRTTFLTSLKGGTNCQKWAETWQKDAVNLFPESGIVPTEVPLTILDDDMALRDDFFTAPFGHPSYVILDGDLMVRHKIVGPCCGYESYSDCSDETAKFLEATLSGYIDAILQEEFESTGLQDTPSTPNDPAAPLTESDAEDCEFSSWSECSVSCGNGTQFRWRNTKGGCGDPVETKPCVQDACIPVECIAEFGATWNITTVQTGFSSPRDVAFHPTPGYHLGNYSEGRVFYPDEGEEAWVANGNNHSVSIVAALGSPRQTTLSRRDRANFHFMINATALAFNTVNDSGRSPDRDTFNYFAICNDNWNTYLGTKAPNNFMGPTLYNTLPEGLNIVNKIGEECGEDEECFFLHSDMLHEAPGCIGMAHDPEVRTTYGNVYWLFDTTGNQENGQLVRFDFSQPHGPGSMDHSVAVVRRFPDVKLTRGEPGVHAGMVVHPQTRQLFISVPGENKVISVHADSGAFARTARQEYPIFSNKLPSFEYSIWECPEQHVFATGIDTPTGLAISPDGEKLFVAERATGMIHAFEIETGAPLFQIETGYYSIGGMAFSPGSQILHFVDANTNTLNSVVPSTPCDSPWTSRATESFGTMVQEAVTALGKKSFSLYKNYTCAVNPEIPDAIFFDQVHDASLYTLGTNLTDMDAEAILVGNRTDCEYNSSLNFDLLLLGGYYCHQCLPDGGGACDSGGTCSNVRGYGYVCDNNFLVMKNVTTGEVQLMHPDKTLVDLDSMVLQQGVTYHFTVRGDLTACIRDTPEVDSKPVPADGNESGCARRGPLVKTISGDTAVSRSFEMLHLHSDDGQVLSLRVEQQ